MAAVILPRRGPRHVHRKSTCPPAINRLIMRTDIIKSG